MVNVGLLLDVTRLGSGPRFFTFSFIVFEILCSEMVWVLELDSFLTLLVVALDADIFMDVKLLNQISGCELLQVFVEQVTWL